MLQNQHYDIWYVMFSEEIIDHFFSLFPINKTICWYDVSCDERRPPPTHMGLQPTWQLFYQPLLAQKNRELNKTHYHSFFKMDIYVVYFQHFAFAGKNERNTDLESLDRLVFGFELVFWAVPKEGGYLCKSHVASLPQQPWPRRLGLFS